MIVSLSQLYESDEPTRIYFVILDRQLSLPSDGASSWNSTQLGLWAKHGRVIAVQNPKFIPGIDTTHAEVVPFHQAYLVKPDLSWFILDQRKSENGILIHTLERRSLSLMVKREGDAICLSQTASLDRTADRLVERGMTLRQFMALQAEGAIVALNKEATGEAGVIELVILPGGVLFQPLKQRVTGKQSATPII
jgi:hypothetical protein